ncbi:MAG: hypothetical protein JRZ94_05500 [Nitrososphaerota archaeon]|nr:hypothetical protein [Nitrososphaerota archaeon]
MRIDAGGYHAILHNSMEDLTRAHHLYSEPFTNEPGYDLDSEQQEAEYVAHFSKLILSDPYKYGRVIEKDIDIEVDDLGNMKFDKMGVDFIA